MAKTAEITFMCESAHSYSTYDSKIKVVVDLKHDDLGNLINSIPKEEMFALLADADLEEWATSNGFVKF